MSPDVIVKVVRDDLKNIKPGKIKKAMTKGLAKGAKIYMRRAKHEAPKFHGDLMSRIKSQEKAWNIYVITSHAPYSAEREYGISPPEKRRVLGVPKFEQWWKARVGTNIPRYARVGRKTPYMIPALIYTIGKIQLSVQREVFKAMEVT